MSHQESPRSTGRGSVVRAVTVVIAVMAVAGALGGLVWLWVAPRVKIRIDANGGSYVDPSLRQYIDADAWYAAICLLLAVVAGVVVWRRLRATPTAAVVALALGGAASSALVWQVGQHWGQIDQAGVRAAKSGDIVSDSLDLGARGLLGLLPVAAIATWLVLDLVREWRRRQRPDEPAPAPNGTPTAEPDPAPSSLT